MRVFNFVSVRVCSLSLAHSRCSFLRSRPPIRLRCGVRQAIAHKVINTFFNDDRENSLATSNANSSEPRFKCACKHFRSAWCHRNDTRTFIHSLHFSSFAFVVRSIFIFSFSFSPRHHLLHHFPRSLRQPAEQQFPFMILSLSSIVVVRSIQFRHTI